MGEIAASQAVARKGPADIVAGYLNDFAQVLPSHIRPETFVRLSQGLLRQKPDIAEAAAANPASLIATLFECARLGHDPGTDAYALTARKLKGVPTILGIEQYGGVVERMYRAGAVKSIHADVVRKNDRYVPPNPARGQMVPIHEFDPFASDEERGELVGTYAYAELEGGAWSKVVFLSSHEVAKHEAIAGTDTFWKGPWRPAMFMKGLALDTLLPTPTGWTAMGDVRMGDYVIDRHGQPTRVTHLSQVKNLPCFRVTLRNGHSIVCDNEHRWVASINERKESVVSIEEMYQANAQGMRVVLPVSDPWDLSHGTDLPIDPWILGYWLGNGTSASPRVTAHGDDADEVCAMIRSAGYTHGVGRMDTRGNAWTVSIHGLGKALANLGLIGNKHVPEMYLRGSIEQRRALLAGLMDSDGTTWQRGANVGRAKFDSTNRHLRNSVAELARSLGERVLVDEGDKTGYSKTVRAYGCSWTPRVIPFALTRKALRSAARLTPATHSVKSIEKIPTVPTRCIAVDSPTHTYLAGEDCVPTHNTAVHQLEKWVPTSSEYRRQVAQSAAVVANVTPTEPAPSNGTTIEGTYTESK